jgi:hypothetical protein
MTDTFETGSPRSGQELGQTIGMLLAAGSSWLAKLPDETFFRPQDGAWSPDGHVRHLWTEPALDRYRLPHPLVGLLHHLMRLRRVPVLASLALAACTQWSRVAAPAPAEFPPRQQVQVWHRSGRADLHGVTVTADSLSGVPFWKALDCDSCRQAFARADIDSLRTGNRETAGILLAAIPLIALGVLALGLSGYGAD